MLAKKKKKFLRIFVCLRTAALRSRREVVKKETEKEEEKERPEEKGNKAVNKKKTKKKTTTKGAQEKEMEVEKEEPDDVYRPVTAQVIC